MSIQDIIRRAEKDIWYLTDRKVRLVLDAHVSLDMPSITFRNGNKAIYLSKRLSREFNLFEGSLVSIFISSSKQIFFQPDNGKFLLKKNNTGGYYFSGGTTFRDVQFALKSGLENIRGVVDTIPVVRENMKLYPIKFDL